MGCLAAAVHRSEPAAIAGRWLDTYLTGPVWRFVLAAGICGEGAYTGMLVPSVDRVGRYFPLTVIAQLDAQDCPLAIACESTDWFESAETLVLGALEAEALDFDTFDEQIALLRERLDGESAVEASRVMNLLRDSEFPAESARWQLPLGDGGSLQGAVNVLAYREMTRTLQPFALWWTQGSGSMNASLLATRGLPEARSFVAMLSGNWAGADWSSVRAAGRV